MYQYHEITSLSLEVTSKCQARCPMCARNYHGDVENPLLPINDIPIDLLKQIIPVDFVKQLRAVTMCGNFGDPILYKDLILAIEYFATNNPSIYIEIDTNGSARTKDWWRNLAKALPDNHRVQFGIDGLSDTNHIYRVGTDYNTIIENAQAFIDAGGKARWNYIIFKHNQHQLEQAKQIANDLGFESFREKESSRFIGSKSYDVLDRNGNVAYKLEAPTEQRITFVTKEIVENYKQIFSQATINCQVKQTKTIHINAQGYVWPCTFVAAIPYLYEKPGELVYNYIMDSRKNLEEFLDSKFGGMEFLNLRHTTIESVVNSTQWQTEWDKVFRDNSVYVCTRACGKFTEDVISQCRDQFLDVQNFIG
jgi:MoaA/NifB/PqqE/SkfB family radical SAM enzyme